VSTPQKPLAGSTVADINEHPVFDRVPEEGDLDAVRLAKGKDSRSGRVINA
jgi:hypothetical protein